VFASRQGGGGSDGPLNAIAAAAERTQSEPGGRAAMEAVVSPAGGKAPITIKGQMVFNGEGRNQAVMTFPRPDSDGSVKMYVVGDGTMTYMRSSQFGSPPEGREWMGFDLSLGQGSGALPANVDAKSELELLESVSNDVRKLGVEDVRGVPTTHYRGTVGVAKQTERLQDEGMEDLASITEKKGAPVEVEAWIDADGLLRRMRIIQTQPGEGDDGPTAIDMRVDFLEFGIDPEIDVPDSSEVFDMTPLIKEKLDDSSG
jgi:hypothetical protein